MDYAPLSSEQQPIQPLISVANLCYEYSGGQQVLHDVSFQMEEGSIMALVGPNGAGKTTLMRCLAALEPPFSGSIHVSGIDIFADPRAHHKNIGYLSDFFGVYPHLNVEQVLAFTAATRSITPSQLPQRLADTLDLLDLSTHAKKLTSELSRGLRQRLGIGLAIIHRPKLLILDEPASGLDPEARIGLTSLFLKLRKAGISILVSSHILAELEDYSTHMLVMQAGRILENRSLGSHSNINSSIPSSGHYSQTTMHLVLSTLFPGLEQLLASLPGIAALRPLEADSRSVYFDLVGPPEARPAFLRSLIEAGVAVEQFAPIRADMQQAYLDTLRRNTAKLQ
jgi:ABC-2 type transport system ATP-binding protein